jgi:2-polyprenyl-6-methoxyphenol hydroxylase-like FAD-dependent oxidoreductase
MSTSVPTHDVIIMGGGLAGLTLALQLRQTLPELDVLVLERRTHPVPEACHKVGESTVEIGAHYFANVLGLKQHLDSAQLKKFGFRFFFSEAEATSTPSPSWAPAAHCRWAVGRSTVASSRIFWVKKCSAGAFASLTTRSSVI